MLKKLDQAILKYLSRNPKLQDYRKTREIFKIIPKNTHKGITDISIERTHLIIKTKNPSWRQEITFLKKEIIKKIHKKVPNYNIKEIKVL